MNTKFKIPATFAMLALTMTGCSIFQQQTVPQTAEGVVKTETLKETEGVISHLFYGEWTAFDVNGQAVTGENRPTVIFDKSGSNPFVVTCYANNGCNTLNGSFSVTPGGKMKPTSDFASTMRLCPDAPYEMGFNMALNYVTNYSIEQVGGEYLLYLKDDTGKKLMTLRKDDVAFLDGAWRVTTIGDKEVAASKGLELAFDISDLKVHGNAGCNVLNANIAINPATQNSISFSDINTTRMTCPDIELEQQLINAMSSTASVVAGKNNNTAQFKDASGKQLFSISRITLKQ